MAEQILFTPQRVFSTNATLEPGAKAYFYESGTTTRLPVYTTQGLGTEHPVPLTADAQGVFPQVFHDGAYQAKVTVTDADDVVLDGFPIDPVPSTTTASGAAQIGFDPIPNNPSTDVQTAIATNTTLAISVQNSQLNAQRTPETAGTGDAYTLAPPKTITAYSTGQAFQFLVDRDNTGAVTLNIDGIGPKNVQRYNTAASLIDLIAGDWLSGEIHRVVYDGTQMVMISPVGAKTQVRGLVEKATTAEAEAGTADEKYPDVVKVKEAIDAQVPARIRARACVDGTAGTPAATGALNIASITDNGTGDYTVNFTSAMPDTTYQAFVTVDENGADGRCFATIEKATGSVRVRLETATGAAADFDFSLMVIGA